MELVQPKPEILLETAYVYLRLNQLKQAETFFTHYLEIRPRHLDVNAELAFLLLKNGKKQEAIQRMTLILEK
jgi:predicted Zn-dependent protease